MALRRNCTQPPSKWGPPRPLSAPLLTLEPCFFPAGAPRALEHTPLPAPEGPYLLPRVPLPSHIPVWRTGGRETEESSVRGLGASHLHCSGSRAGLGSPPKPGRSRRRPRSLRCRRRGACSSSPCERRVAASAQARPMGPGGGRERVKRGARRQQRPMERGGGAGPTQRPLAATRGRAAWREGSGGGTAQWRRVPGAETIEVLETLPTLEDVTVSTRVETELSICRTREAPASTFSSAAFSSYQIT
ncbi:uncharacterized protein LOC121827508 [Peromyscus maniculatus bairdii]|uniref:uncharacterized protein LOC121827508 n=1 Tax=Peromyscus maniculatus bairdii TaxID=230844 RepID=UPI003FD4C5DF